jgi:hypothetical protein
MFGRLLFGETPFGDVLIKAYVDRGWQRQCRGEAQWSKKPPSVVNLKPCDFSILDQRKEVELWNMEQ